MQNHRAYPHTSKHEKTLDLYSWVIDAVTHHCSPDFDTDGGGSEALAVFKDLWKSKLKPVMEEQKHKISSQAKLSQFSSNLQGQIRVLPRHQNTPGRFAPSNTRSVNYVHQFNGQQQFQRQGMPIQRNIYQQPHMKAVPKYVINHNTGTSSSSSVSLLPSSRFLPMTKAPQHQLVQLQPQGRMNSTGSSAQLQKLTPNPGVSGTKIVVKGIQKQLSGTTGASRFICVNKASPSEPAANNTSQRVVVQQRVQIGSKAGTSGNLMKVVKNEKGVDVIQLDGTNGGGDFDKKLKKTTRERRKKIVQKFRQNDGSFDSESEPEEVSQSNEDSGEDDIKNEAESEELHPDEQKSDDEVTSEEDPEEMFETDHLVVCQYSKVIEKKGRWKMDLKCGIMKLDGVDTVFQIAEADIQW